jgi:Major Facilitator Superfamily
MTNMRQVQKYPDEISPLLRNYGTLSSDKKDVYVTETEVPASECSDADNDSPYLLNLTASKFWVIFAPILVQYFVAMFDSFLMVSSHPVITSYFNASNSASWLSTAFMLTSASLQPIFGRMSDMYGRRSVYMSALLIFAIGTAYCAGAQTIGDFIAGRAICGVGAGAMISMVCRQSLYMSASNKGRETSWSTI